MNKQVHNWLSSIGKRGGAAGTGEAKRRGTPEYYKRLSDLGKAARAAKAETKAKADPNQNHGNGLEVFK